MGSFRADVVALRNGNPVLAIEIRVTHAVDDAKGLNLPISWIELDARAIVEDPRRWRPLNARVRDARCDPCGTEIAKIKALSQAQNIDLPRDAEHADEHAPYAAATMPCWSCKQETVVFRWAGTPFAQTPPPMPRPRTLKWRHSKTWGGSYWMNTCGRCGAPSGDNFLYLFTGALFRHYPHRRHSGTNAIAEAFAARLLGPRPPRAMRIKQVR